MVDPPRPTDKEELGLSSIGVKLWRSPETGATHVFDWIGEEHYENVADFVEEVRRFGLSRRLARTLDFSRLGPESRLLLVHPRAYLSNHVEFYARLEPTWDGCPRRKPEHVVSRLPDLPVGVGAGKIGAVASPSQMCAGLWWHDIEGGRSEGHALGTVVREMPSFSYRGTAAPDNSARRPALFAAFPISHLVVIRDARQGTHEIAETAAARSSLPVVLEDD